MESRLLNVCSIATANDASWPIVLKKSLRAVADPLGEKWTSQIGLHAARACRLRAK